MPQLNPDPWFFILMASWTIFLTIVPVKVLGYVKPNEPAPTSTQNYKFGSWNWPW